MPVFLSDFTLVLTGEMIRVALPMRAQGLIVCSFPDFLSSGVLIAKLPPHVLCPLETVPRIFAVSASPES